jgi:hypothetical protein
MTFIALPLPEEDRDYPARGAVEGFDVVNSFSFDIASFINERLAERRSTIIWSKTWFMFSRELERLY